MARKPFPSHGLYAITADPPVDRSRLPEQVAAALRGGAAVIQYRAKHQVDHVSEASVLLALCRAAGVPLIINDDVELAFRVGADGVHLGRDDGRIADARQRLGAAALIGVSCYDAVERAVRAAEEGADYVAFGRFFPSRSKPDAPCARLETLRQAQACLTVPIVAIGGITPINGGSLLAAGADLLAVIEGVFGEGREPESAAGEFRQLWASGEAGGVA